ncbi:hypothetical protein EBS80_05265, partial [bacterium]|nr:hypothetical protein [bacterium]
ELGARRLPQGHVEEHPIGSPERKAIEARLEDHARRHPRSFVAIDYRRRTRKRRQPDDFTDSERVARRWVERHSRDQPRDKVARDFGDEPLTDAERRRRAVEDHYRITEPSRTARGERTAEDAGRAKTGQGRAAAIEERSSAETSFKAAQARRAGLLRRRAEQNVDAQLRRSERKPSKAERERLVEAEMQRQRNDPAYQQEDAIASEGVAKGAERSAAAEDLVDSYKALDEMRATPEDIDRVAAHLDQLIERETSNRRVAALRAERDALDDALVRDNVTTAVEEAPTPKAAGESAAKQWREEDTRRIEQDREPAARTTPEIDEQATLTRLEGEPRTNPDNLEQQVQAIDDWYEYGVIDDGPERFATHADVPEVVRGKEVNEQTLRQYATVMGWDGNLPVFTRPIKSGEPG